MKQKISVILPTYNEKDNILPLINCISNELKDYNFEILVIDDDSPDGTGQRVLDSKKKNVRTIIRKTDKGLASAIKHGIIQSKGDIVVIMDTDFNHHPKYIPRLLHYLPEYDISIGSRFVKGGGMEGAKIRWYASYMINLFIRTMLKLKTRENLSGFLAIKKEVLSHINLNKIFKGYGDYNIRLFNEVRGKKIKEIPVIYKKRLYGESKTRLIGHLIQYIKTVIRLRCNTR